MEALSNMFLSVGESMGGWVFAPFVGMESSYRAFEVHTGGC